MAVKSNKKKSNKKNVKKETALDRFFKSNKSLKLVIGCILCLLILGFSTYAWFIGMRTVNVTSFDIEIASTDSLYLSMDGEHWSYNLDVKNSTPYVGNANIWAENGLVPISTIGEVDKTSSRMMIYSKGSLTTSPGGYRLLAGRVDNYTNTNASGQYVEADGYVAFDLFVKNLSGNEYYVDNNILNEEDIFLTHNSKVTIASDGIAGTGIENSVRVAFAQIGRVKADTDSSSPGGIENITSLTCSDKAASASNVQATGICRSGAIWEPNDSKHVSNAISWYDTSCRKRTAYELTDIESYSLSTHCKTVTDDLYVPTYAISRELTIADKVDIYDGAELNMYTANTATYSAYKTALQGKTTPAEITAAKSNFKLIEYPYYTDTVNSKKGVERLSFMQLAPNSITKVRVYIYIEGQDIDNYDFASLGYKISVNFGFTKERYDFNDFPEDFPNGAPTASE